MPAPIVDIHPHIISADTQRYPHAPLYGIQSLWSKDRPADVDQLLNAMDEAGVAKAAIVHASTCYGFDNSLVADAAVAHRGRCTAVGSVNMTSPGAVNEALRWIDRGVTGLRIFTGGSTKKVDASGLDDPASYPVWEMMNERGLCVCIQTDASGVPAMKALAARFPNVPVIADHFSSPDVGGGPNFQAAAPMFSMAEVPNIHLKFTPILLLQFEGMEERVQDFLGLTVEKFGAGRIAWGSNWPNSPGTLKEILAAARAALAGLSVDEQEAVLGGTALRLYRALAG